MLKFRFGPKLIIASVATTVLLAGGFTRAAYAESNASDELAEMYKQDQDDRRPILDGSRKADWATISSHDKARHDRVLSLMKEDKLRTGDDYYHASMIMQHGDEPKDYMLAHIFAMAAAQAGNKPAIWLSAASFDRLMQSVKQPQVFGTQFFGKADEPLELGEPSATDLITNTVRHSFNVPTPSENLEQLKQLKEQSGSKSR